MNSVAIEGIYYTIRYKASYRYVSYYPLHVVLCDMVYVTS